MKIGYRTLKTAIATPIAIAIAQLTGVTNIVSPGIITILCIQPSRKQSMESALHRFLACILAMIFSVVFFELLGYHLIVLGALLTIFIPTTVFLKIEKGIMTSTVITLNLFSFGTIKVDFLTDQFLLIIIGIGIGLLVNLYMPSLDKPLHSMQQELEQNFKTILHEIALYIKEGNMEWDGQEITHVIDVLEEAEELVERDRENQFFREKNSFGAYFSMRKKQFDYLKQMLPLVTRLPKKDELTERIAQFFDDLSKSVHSGNTAIIFLVELEGIRQIFNQNPLPTTQETFETRASLFQLLFLIEEYLKLKNNYEEPIGGKSRRRIFRRKKRKTG